MTTYATTKDTNIAFLTTIIEDRTRNRTNDIILHSAFIYSSKDWYSGTHSNKRRLSYTTCYNLLIRYRGAVTQSNARGWTHYFETPFFYCIVLHVSSQCQCPLPISPVHAPFFTVQNACSELVTVTASYSEKGSQLYYNNTWAKPQPKLNASHCKKTYFETLEILAILMIER